MKISGSKIEKGMTIKVSSILNIDGVLSVGCGSIKKNSPSFKVLDILGTRKIQGSSMVVNNSLTSSILETSLGTIRVSHRQKVEVIY